MATPTAASPNWKGMKVTNENDGEEEQAIITTIIDEQIVAGTECFRIPKYNGIKLIPAVAIEYGTIFMTSSTYCCIVIWKGTRGI